MEKKYEVINYFTDLRDYDHPYNVGDEFPRQGVTVSDERIAELLSGRNKQRRPLIKVVECSDKQKAEEPKAPDPSTQNENHEPEAKTEVAENRECAERAATTDSTGENNKYSKEYIETLKLSEIREIAKNLGFKISSTSKDGAVVEFMEKQG